jgi:NADPH-dependent 2,4-dienoyl-CoA reductase/sulfur reductase-like enzyme
VERFEENTAHLRSGGTVPFDVLVLALGVRPDTALLAAAGAKINKGVLVGNGLRTSLAGIWAAGDCTEAVDVTTGETSVLANLPSAAMQGQIAGAGMAGGDVKFDQGIKMNSIGFFGLHIMSAGTYTDCVLSEVTDDGCKKLFAKDGFLTGFILLGDVRKAGIYTALIRERTPLASIDFEAVKREPSLLPFGSAYRQSKLGGAV